MIISNISVSNFKSFLNAAEIPVCEGLNVIVGENGAGKSVLLDAVSFALGEVPANIRSKSLNELGAPGADTFVELTFTSRTDRKTTVKVGSLVQKGKRYYLLDKSRVPKNRFEMAVSHTLGLHHGGGSVANQPA